MNRLPYLLLTLAGVCWGLGFPLGKLAMRETDAAHMILLRFAVAAVVAAPFVLRNARTRALFRSPAVLAAGALYGVAFIVEFEGLARTSVSLSALLVGAMPALIAIGSRLLGERVTRTSWIGVAAATVGAALLAGRPDGAGAPLGIALALGALLIFLAWLYASRAAPPSPGPLAVPAATMIVAAVTVLPIALVMHGAPNLDLSATAWAAIAGQGVLATLVATAAWQYGAARVGAAQAGVFINLEPVMGAVLGVTLFADRLTLGLAFGGLLILAGSLLVVLGEDPAKPLDLSGL